MHTKQKAFEFVCYQLYDWYEELNTSHENDLSILKVMKLLFFVAAVKKGDSTDLLETFTNFKAMPLGPVEMDVYTQLNNIMRNGSVYIDRDHMVVNRVDQELSDADRESILVSVDALKSKNRDIINYDASRLVNLSHKWDSWKKSFNMAIFNGKNIWVMNPDLIRKDTPHFL